MTVQLAMTVLEAMGKNLNLTLFLAINHIELINQAKKLMREITTANEQPKNLINKEKYNELLEVWQQLQIQYFLKRQGEW